MNLATVKEVTAGDERMARSRKPEEITFHRDWQINTDHSSPILAGIGRSGSNEFDCDQVVVQSDSVRVLFLGVSSGFLIEFRLLNVDTKCIFSIDKCSQKD
jgi:hypothetical protein